MVIGFLPAHICCLLLVSLPVCNAFPSVPAPSAPGFIHFSELTTTSVNVSWGEPTFPNGIIEGYRLVYEPSTPVDGKCLAHKMAAGFHAHHRMYSQQYKSLVVLTIAAVIPNNTVTQ